MTSTAKKGYLKEKRCRDDLIEDGWTIVFKSVRWRYGCIDFAELFDVVAIKKNPEFPKHPDWKFISVKHLTSGNYYLQHQKELRRFKTMYGLEGMTFELWLWEKAGWRGRHPNKTHNKAKWRKIIL